MLFGIGFIVVVAGEKVKARGWDVFDAGDIFRLEFSGGCVGPLLLKGFWAFCCKS